MPGAPGATKDVIIVTAFLGLPGDPLGVREVCTPNLQQHPGAFIKHASSWSLLLRLLCWLYPQGIQRIQTVHLLTDAMHLRQWSHLTSALSLAEDQRPLLFLCRSIPNIQFSNLSLLRRHISLRVATVVTGTWWKWSESGSFSPPQGSR